ncbi:MAG: AbrB/MazE/SpoVT family DNA-binding domain-containing protein [Thermodesulfobacteriota bacterium]
MPFSVTSKGQVTIPKEIREYLDIRANDRVEFVREGNRVLIVPVKTLKDLRGAVPSKGKGDFSAERARAKSAVAKRARGEME